MVFLLLGTNTKNGLFSASREVCLLGIAETIIKAMRQLMVSINMSNSKIFFKSDKSVYFENGVKIWIKDVGKPTSLGLLQKAVKI